MSRSDILTLADGTRVLPDGSSVRPFTQVEMSTVSELTVPTRAMSSISAPPHVFNTVAVVLVYTLLGISDDEIVSATKLTLDRVKQVRCMDAYMQARGDIVRNAADGEAEKARAVMAQGAFDAANSLVTLSETAVSEFVRLGALKDILDRAGLRPVDVIDHRMKMEGGLVINIIRKDVTDTAQMIDITGERSNA